MNPSPALLRHALRGLASLLALAALSAVGVMVLSESRLKRIYRTDVVLDAPGREHAARGRELAWSRGCADCHGDDFGGRVMIDDLPFARIVAGSITPHADESAAEHHARIFRAIHHGLDGESKPLLLMPSAEFAHLSARETEAIAAYLGTLPTVERELPDSVLGPAGRALLVAGLLEGFLSAEAIDHTRPVIAEPPPMGTLDYGRHAAQLCTGCHRPDFGGGRMPHGPPGAPKASNLTPHSSGLAGWTEADFMVAMRRGRRPDGTAIDGRFMPWGALGRAKDEELKAIWAFLQRLPPVDATAPDRP